MDWSEVGSIATALGVAFAAWQVAGQRVQFRVAFQDELWREQRDIVASIPPRLLLERRDHDGIDAASVEEIRLSDDELISFVRYFDACNEQALYAARGRIGRHTWRDWRGSMLANLQRPTFFAAWEQIQAARGPAAYTYFKDVLAGEHSIPRRRDIFGKLNRAR